MINEQKIWRHIGVAVLVLVSWILFAIFKSIYAWALIPVFAAVAMLVGNPRAMLWWGLGYFMIAQYVGAELRVGFFGYIDEIITLGMLGVLFVLARQKDSMWENRKPLLRPLPKIAFFFLLLTVLSALASRSVDIYLLMWCFQYLRMFVILFFAARFLRVEDPQIFVRFIMIFSLIQVVLNLGWKFHINPLPSKMEYAGPDFGVGTLNGCDSVAYFCVLVVILCLAIALDPPSKSMRNIAWGTIFLTMINFMLTNTNHAYFILAGALGVFFLMNKRAVTKIISGPTLIGLGGVAAIVMVLFSLTDAGMALRPEYLRRRYENFINGTKIESYQRNFRELPKETSLFWALGIGPGQAGSAIGSALRRPIADKYFNVLYNEERYRQDVREGSIATGPNTGILTYWSELGPLGLYMIALIYIAAFLKSKRMPLTNGFSDKYQAAINRSLPSVFTVMLLIAFLRDLMHMAWLIGVVWVWAVLAFIPLGRTSDPSGIESPSSVNRWRSMAGKGTGCVR